MSDITLLPADLAAMTVAQLAALPSHQKVEIDRNLNEAQSFLKQVRTKFDAAMNQAYGQQARAALRESGRDFGTTYVNDGPLQVKKQLAEIAERIVAAGEKPGSYLDVKLSVPEARYTNWPPALQQQFAAARTVEAGKPDITLSFDGEAA